MELKRVFERLFSKGGNLINRKELPQFTLAKLRLASHPDAKPATLKKLSSHKCESIVARVAENRNTCLETLELLAIHPISEVRIAVAENSNTPPKILLCLAIDSDVDVRYSLAENHNVAVSVLSVLAEDSNPYVADRASKTLNRIQQSVNRDCTFFPSIRGEQRQRGVS